MDGAIRSGEDAASAVRADLASLPVLAEAVTS